MSSLMEIIVIAYVSVHTIILLATFCFIARVGVPEGTSFCSGRFFQQLRRSFATRPGLAVFAILHFVDVGLDYAVLSGWLSDQNAFRSVISYNGYLLLFPLALHIISKITSSLYIYGVTRQILPTLLQFLDLEIYYDMYFDPNCTAIDVKIEEIYRCHAVMQAFPMSIIQTYLLVTYQLIDDEPFYKATDLHFITMTFVSLLSSLFFIVCLQINQDAKFLNNKGRMTRCGMPKWFIRVFFRSFELLSRVLLLTYIWVLYGLLAITGVLVLEWLFQIYNHYRKERYDNSHEHSVRMSRKQNKFFLWPLVMDELISFWNFDWKLSANNAPKQRSFDIIDLLQGWTLASYIYGNKSIRKSTMERPPCECKKPMDEYWTTAFEPIHHEDHLVSNLHRNSGVMATKPISMIPESSVDLQAPHRGKGRSVGSNSSAFLTSPHRAAPAHPMRAATKPKCASCGRFVAITSHYFRCPSFLQSGSLQDPGSTEKITKHRHYLCIHCGYARMTYLPFLFVVSRNIFTWIYVAVLTVLASLIGIDCSLLCIDLQSGSLNNEFHVEAYKSLLFLVAASFHFVTPIFFILILTTRQTKLREIEAKSWSGKVVNYARRAEWDKVYQLIRHEDCDVNEVDRDGRSPLLYAAIQHNFQVIRDLQQFGADMEHVDINSCGVRYYLDAFVEKPDDYGVDDDDEQNPTVIEYDYLTAPTRAAKTGCAPDLHLCIELGCDLNKVDGNGHTPLLIACKEREIEIVEILIEYANKYGARKVDLNKPDKDGRTAVIIVTQYGYNDVLQLLLDTAQDIDVVHRDNEGISAFEHAISCNQKKCAKLIHQYKKERNIEERPSKMEHDEDNQSDSPDIAASLPKRKDSKLEIARQSVTKIAVPAELQQNELPSTEKPKKKDENTFLSAINTEQGAEAEADAEDRLDGNLRGDVRKHPIPESPLTPMTDHTPSKIELHHSDSIDRRIIRALTVENKGSLPPLPPNKMKKHMSAGDTDAIDKTMSIVVTNADGQ